jgi:hypothetical protein
MRMPRTVVTPRTAARGPRASITIDSHMKLFFANATHAGLIRVRVQIRVKQKMLLIPERVEEVSYIFPIEILTNDRLRYYRRDWW